MLLSLKPFYFFLAISFVLFSNCARKANVTSEENYLHLFRLDTLNTNSIIKTIVEKSSFNYFSGRGQFSIQNEKEELESGIQLSIVRDSALLMTSKKLGVEIARMLIHQERFQILDRIEKVYSSGPLAAIKQWEVLALHQQLLQNMLIFGFHLPVYMSYSIHLNGQSFSIIGKSESESLQLIGNAKNLQTERFIWTIADHKLDINMNQYKTVNKKKFPGFLNIRLFENGEEKINAQVLWKNIDDKPIEKLTFKIPDHYTQKSK